MNLQLCSYKNYKRWQFLNWGETIDDCDIIVTAGGSQHWFKSGTTGNYHRLDGPAYINKYNEADEYWIDGKKYDEKEYWQRIKMRSFW